MRRGAGGAADCSGAVRGVCYKWDAAQRVPTIEWTLRLGRQRDTSPGRQDISTCCDPIR